MKGKCMMKMEKYNGVQSILGKVSYQDFTMSVYQYLVDGMLIDTSAYRLLDELIPFYEESDIDFVSLTHNHEDHTGTAAWLQQEKQLPIYIHPQSIEACAQKATYPEYRQTLWGVRPPFQARPYGDSIESRQYTWDIIHTPGHQENHVCLLNKQTGALFSGDLFITPKTKIIMKDESIPTIIASIRKVLSYDFQEMYCSHSGYHLDGRSMFTKKLHYLEELSGNVHERYAKGMTMEEINQELFPKVPSLTHYSNHEWDSIHIIRSIIEDSGKT